MAVLGGPFQIRKAPSYRGCFYVRKWRGQLVVSKWPTKRKRPLPPHTREQNEWFKQANRLCKYVPAELQVSVREAVKDTPLMPRDLLVAAMAGRLYAIVDPERGVLYSRAMANDVSQNLDIIGQAPGDMLARGPDQWTRVPGAAAGWMLFSQGAAVPAAWAAGQPAARAVKTIGQTVGASAETVLTWQTTDFDDDNLWSGASPTVLTIPTGWTRATITAGIRSSSSVVDGFALNIVRGDGARFAGFAAQENGGIQATCTTGPIPVTPGHTFEARVFTTFGRTFDADPRTFLAAQRDQA